MGRHGVRSRNRRLERLRPIVDGRLAGIQERDGTLRNGPEGWSGGGSGRTPRKPPPVRFDTQGGPEPNVPGQTETGLLPPEIERRTLPGRTIITGIADSDVASVTLATPRDIRTLRPSGPQHTLIAVYDGQFFRGAITAAVKLRSGRTVTVQVPNGPGGIINSTPVRPSLPARLRSDQSTLRGMRSQVLTSQALQPEPARQTPSRSTARAGHTRATRYTSSSRG